MSYLYILLILLIPFAYIFVRFIIKRLYFILRLKNICKQFDYKLYTTSPLWIFGSNNSSKNDFSVESDGKIYSVRFIPTFLKRRIYTFCDANRYTLSDVFPFPRVPYRRKLADRILRAIDYSSLVSTKGKDIVPVLLFNPAPMNVSYLDGTKEQQAGDGDKVFGITIFGASGFLKFLKQHHLNEYHDKINTASVHII